MFHSDIFAHRECFWRLLNRQLLKLNYMNSNAEGAIVGLKSEEVS
jgi:hypothetical protein